MKSEEPKIVPKIDKMEDNNLEGKALIPSKNVSVVRTESPSKKSKNDLMPRIGAALFYGVASFMIMVVNKHVLTIHKFPSFQTKETSIYYVGGVDCVGGILSLRSPRE